MYVGIEFFIGLALGAAGLTFLSKRIRLTRRERLLLDILAMRKIIRRHGYGKGTDR